MKSFKGLALGIVLSIAILALILLPSPAVRGQGFTQPLPLFTSTVSAAGALSGVTDYPNSSVHVLGWNPTGSPTSCTVQLETSSTLAGAYSLYTGSSAQTCTSQGWVTIYGASSGFVRVNVTALSGGTSPTLTVGVLANIGSYGPGATASYGPLNAILISNSITPTATAAAIGVATQTFTYTGLNSGDKVIALALPAPTALCPPVGFRATAANTLSIDFSVLTAVACTPATGTYGIAVVR